MQLTHRSISVGAGPSWRQRACSAVLLDWRLGLTHSHDGDAEHFLPGSQAEDYQRVSGWVTHDT